MRAIVGHFEIPSRAPRRLGRFYRRAFDWRVEEVAWEGPEYLKLRAPEGDGSPGGAGLAGGIFTAESGAVGSPLAVVHLSEGSLEECLRRIEDAGGKVDQAPRRVGEMGRFARFRDPEGNLWGLWEAS